MSFFVQAAFFRQVADHANVFLLQWLSENVDISCIRINDLIDDTDEGGLTSAVRPKQSEDRFLRNGDAYIVECEMIGIALCYAFGNKCFHR